MTDARFPERWLNDRRIIRLTDSAFRTFVLGMTWAVANRTDGYVERDDLDFIHGADPAVVEELMKAGLWSQADDVGFMIEDFTKVQTPASQLDGLDRKKEQDAKRAKEYRERQKGQESPPSRDSSRDDIGQAGQARTGQALSTEPKVEGDSSRDGADPFSSEPCLSCGRPIANYQSGMTQCQDCAPTVHTSGTRCAFNACTESARPGKQMCQMHFTREPSSTAA